MYSGFILLSFYSHYTTFVQTSAPYIVWAPHPKAFIHYLQFFAQLHKHLYSSLVLFFLLLLFIFFSNPTTRKRKENSVFFGGILLLLLLMIMLLCCMMLYVGILCQIHEFSNGSFYSLFILCIRDRVCMCVCVWVCVCVCVGIGKSISSLFICFFCCFCCCCCCCFVNPPTTYVYALKGG